MINYKVLSRAMMYMLLPTIIVFAGILLGFLNWTKFVDFMTSDSTLAYFIRFSVYVLEIVCVYFMYISELEKEEILNTNENGLEKKTVSTSSSDLYYAINNSVRKTINHFELYKKSEDTFIVKIM